MDNHYLETIEKLNQGNVILYPTDTIWGIGCDVFNESAVENIYHIKKRDRSKPLILLVSNINMLKYYVPHIHPRIETLLHYHKRPLTIIYKDPIHLPDWILAKDNSIAIRLVLNSFIKNTIEKYGKPIVSTSANIQGDPTPEEYDSISKKLIKKVDHIVPLTLANKVQRSASVIIRYDKEGEIELVR